MMPSSVMRLSKAANLVSRLSTRTFATSTRRMEETHTGQSWEADDLRNTRFLHHTKQTNTKWAIDLIANVPPKIVTQRVVACDGGDNPALGHPRVFINLDNHDPVSCIYCGLRYQLKSDH